MVDGGWWMMDGFKQEQQWGRNKFYHCDQPEMWVIKRVGDGFETRCSSVTMRAAQHMLETFVGV